MVNLSLGETQFASYGNKISRSAREKKEGRRGGRRGSTRAASSIFPISN